LKKLNKNGIRKKTREFQQALQLLAKQAKQAK
jgi:hypothetical protein